MWLSAWPVHWSHSRNLSPARKSSTKFCIPSEVMSPQQSFTPPPRFFTPLCRICCFGVITQRGHALSFPEIIVLPWSSPSTSDLQISDLLQKLRCRSDLLLEFAIYFCRSHQCLWPVSTVCSFIIPREASSLWGYFPSISPYFLLSFGFCNLFLQVLSDFDFLVIGFSMGHSPVKLLNMHH